MTVHVICTAGVVYGILNDMPMFKYAQGKNGNIEIIEYFYKDMQAQWAGEGFIVSVLTATIGIFYAILSRIGNKFESPMVTRIAVIVIIAILWNL